MKFDLTSVKNYRATQMFVAYKNRELRINEIPAKDITVFLHPIATRAEAIQILAEAARQRPDICWVIVGRGPWGVAEKAWSRSPFALVANVKFMHESALDSGVQSAG